jgi:hypothetical protein
MANKKSFIVYLDSLCILDKLSTEQKGLLFDAIYRYQLTGEVPTLDPITDLVFTPFVSQFKRDESKYTEKINERSESGRKGNLKRYYPDLFDKVIKGEIDLVDAEEIANTRKNSLSENSDSSASLSVATVANLADNVNVNDSVSVNENEKEKSTSLEILKKEKEIELQHPLNEYIFNAESDFTKLKKIFKPMKNVECEKVIERAKELMPVGDHYRSVIVRALEKMDGSKSVDKKSSLYRTLLNYLVYAKADIVADMSADNRLEKMKGTVI